MDTERAQSADSDQRPPLRKKSVRFDQDSSQQQSPNLQPDSRPSSSQSDQDPTGEQSCGSIVEDLAAEKGQVMQLKKLVATRNKTSVASQLKKAFDSIAPQIVESEIGFQTRQIVCQLIEPIKRQQETFNKYILENDLAAARLEDKVREQFDNYAKHQKQLLKIDKAVE